jgi:hypothetical protein
VTDSSDASLTVAGGHVEPEGLDDGGKGQRASEDEQPASAVGPHLVCSVIDANYNSTPGQNSAEAYDPAMSRGLTPPTWP